jgi:hypothetical protein
MFCGERLPFGWSVSGPMSGLGCSSNVVSGYLFSKHISYFLNAEVLVKSLICNEPVRLL